jgi:hypothetical protein
MSDVSHESTEKKADVVKKTCVANKPDVAQKRNVGM